MSVYAGNRLTSDGMPASASGPSWSSVRKSFHERVREVLVEDDGPRVIGTGHHPAVARQQQVDAGLPAELVVDVAPDAEGEVELLGLEPVDLAAQETLEADVALARCPEQLVVGRVPTEDRVRLVEEDDRRLGEVGVPLILEATAGHEVAGRRSIDDLVGEDRRPASAASSMTAWPASDSLRMLARRYHDDRCQKRLADASASDWVASRPSSSASQAGTIGKSGRIELRLNASVDGHMVLLPKPSASRW